MATYKVKRRIAARLPGTDEFFVKTTTRANVNWCVMVRLADDDQWRVMHWLAQQSDASAKRNHWIKSGFQAAIVRTQDWAG